MGTLPRVSLDRPLAARLALGLALAATGYALADRVVPRLSDHRGHFLFAHDDRVTVALPRRPRRTVVAVIDGLTGVDARRLLAMQRLHAQGRCTLTDVGLPSVSRPVYAVISSGVEQARSGVRNNDETAPARVDSIWQRARAAGLTVSYRSELAWWGELFPQGFQRATVGAASDDLFAAPFTDDLTLVHPVYIDDLSHDHGRTSPQVQRALRRLDDELTRALDGLDLTRDLAVITADHGHRDEGGHGGPGPDITRVVTCFAGPGVRRDRSYPHLDTRDLAPTLAVLLGVPIPRHAAMRRDPGSMLSAVVDRSAIGAAYYDARMEGLGRIRARSAQARAAVTGVPGATWSDVDALALRPRQRRVALAALLSLAAFTWALRRALPRGERATGLIWSLAVAGMHLGIYRVLSGGIDATSLNGKRFFTRNVLLAGAMAFALGAFWHRLRMGAWATLSARAEVLALLALLANLAHIGVYGWPLGYPLPDPYLYFSPFLLSTFLLCAGVAVAGFSARALRPGREP